MTISINGGNNDNGNFVDNTAFRNKFNRDTSLIGDTAVHSELAYHAMSQMHMLIHPSYTVEANESYQPGNDQYN
jgi:hypothetical protein